MQDDVPEGNEVTETVIQAETNGDSTTELEQMNIGLIFPKEGRLYYGLTEAQEKDLRTEGVHLNDIASTEIIIGGEAFYRNQAPQNRKRQTV